MVFEFGVLVFEIGVGGKVHLLLFFGGDSVETIAVNT